MIFQFKRKFLFQECGQRNESSWCIRSSKCSTTTNGCSRRVSSIKSSWLEHGKFNANSNNGKSTMLLLRFSNSFILQRTHSLFFSIPNRQYGFGSIRCRFEYFLRWNIAFSPSILMHWFFSFSPDSNSIKIEYWLWLCYYATVKSTLIFENFIYFSSILFLFLFLSISYCSKCSKCGKCSMVKVVFNYLNRSPTSRPISNTVKSTQPSIEPNQTKITRTKIQIWWILRIRKLWIMNFERT